MINIILKKPTITRS
jgi:hypothetical protein